MANKDHRANHTGAFVRLTHSLLMSEAYRALGSNARALLVDLVMMEKGRHNGALYLSVRDAANRLGLADLSSASAAIDELEVHGFIVMTADAHFSSRATDGSRARSWRLTWLPCKAPPTNDYQDAKPANDRSRKRAERGMRALKTYMRKQNGGQESYTRSTESVSKTRTNAGNARVVGHLPVLETNTPNVETSLVSVDRPCSENLHTYSLPSTGNRRSSSFIAGNTAGASFGASELADLRRRTVAYLAVAEVGAQTRLAADSGIAGGTLSKFKSGASLPADAAVRLDLTLNALAHTRSAA